MGYRLVIEVKFVTNQTSYITAIKPPAVQDFLISNILDAKLRAKNQISSRINIYIYIYVHRLLNLTYKEGPFFPWRDKTDFFSRLL